MKKILCLILSVAMLFALVPALVMGISATETVDKEGVSITSSDGKYSLSVEKTEFKTGEPIMGLSFLSWNSLIVDMINQIG